MKAIETLLPQRYPFLFVDEIISANRDEIIGKKTYDATFLYFQEYFPGKKIVPHSILIESIVQCGGAGVNDTGLFTKALWGLASIETAHFFDSVEPNIPVTMIVKNLRITDKILKQTGTASCDGKKVLEATWLCLKL
ncbi:MULTISPECIES: 3-hydroxyacyl-ACP dehydratase FabZ family protein [Pelosinus]|jgi:3-hydroxyacyl-[acyl-carrier-protein] dehydratase|uniref:Beta-hydroxyacyl-(Acyl-carrier-protein) dehydratase FabA/FabZ n=1 Tax=Pelosinus fermentans B4 TaxID=1149862 RepID=I9B626_9FIRM|nr:MULTISPECIES: 3-hydroxyacyl-ACP dehydratase [Pelosinus]EIW20592.1 Beta-hydroxyacyl-(acyl-carrier-protein) dehydratase FabA/FabZ [Pelosinus fermentans B4]EIW25693.1 Beta-hydroxyacyl-(acyl-carrier-protein) dehydratase FabA/FabZ [Pelosinus fermentans A11]OAM93416.1 Beta-hydroxyacyl-(acyl-carrier-protein) dehydratase FabA/FabZ [Pelosinus fermentans DSM 17108]SDQ77023.1 3-hydroxyacyl-[acyl-carrier-protein] dehydratase [Pelosinus fermentans]